MNQDEKSPKASGENKTFTAPSISLPKGGGAIRGIGEKFAANPVTGTGALTVPIAVSPGRSGFGPQLSLAYNSGSGNGPFGFGWSLTLPQISRKTDKGLPRYRDGEESDVYLLSGAEDLVPVLDAEGVRFEDRTCQPGYTIHRYRPRIEGLFARIERWTHQATGEIHWRSINRENITTLYGKNDDSRIFDPNDPARVFAWLICDTYDDKGNAVFYEYKAEDSQGVDLALAHEQNRSDAARSANRYLKRIQYGNRSPYRPLPRAGLPATPAPIDWLFEVVFDYGEHDAQAPSPAETGAWPCRPDPFSTYRPGFEVRTYRLCQRVLMFHHFPDEPAVGADCLVRSTDFYYTNEDQPDDPRNPIYTFLRAVTLAGYRRADSQAYLKQTLPPLEFVYSQPILQETIQEIDPDSLENLPSGLNGGNIQWLDLDGEGLSGILTRQAGGWYYKRNLSPLAFPVTNGTLAAQFGPQESVLDTPASGGHQQFLDLAGDGQLDLVAMEGPTPGFYERTQEQDWLPYVPFSALPALDWGDPNLRFIDLTGDGLADILITQDEAFSWYPSVAEAGFGPSEHVLKVLDEESGPRLFLADETQSIFLADMSGDGLVDIVRLRNGEVCYWPNLGYGCFGTKVSMDDAPWFGAPDAFQPSRIRLADIDGSGTTDILYLDGAGVQIFYNQSGNRWSGVQRLASFPAVDDLAAVQAVDLLGNGTACLVWSSALPGDVRWPMRYIDLMGGQKPHLLVQSTNNLGAETRIRYAPSTYFYVADRLAGKPWISRIPFPVHVVERIETYDHISHNCFVTRYAYHHGYFDGNEREFRGFGLVEQWDTAEFAALGEDQLPLPAANLDLASHVPPVYTKTWFHTGAYLDRAHISDYFAGLLDGTDTGEYYREPELDDAQARALLLEDTVLPAGLSAEEEREACRVLKGAMLRQEVYALDGTTKEAHPYTVSEQNFTLRLLQPRGDNRHAVFFTHPREAVNYHYERNPDDPRRAHTLTLEVDDFGNVLKSASVGYSRRQPDPTLLVEDQEKQARVYITLTENEYTNPVDLDHDYRTPQPAENRSYELTGLELAAGAGRFTFDDVLQATLAAVEIPYEQTPTTGALEKRLIEHIRTRYRPNDFGLAQGDSLALLPAGQLESLVLPGEVYRQALTPGLVTEVFGGRVTEVMLEEGGYVHSQGDASWWLPSGWVFLSPGADDPAAERAYAADHFFLAQRYYDPFHQPGFETETRVAYDAYDLLLQETRDALDNTLTARLDYRVLQPDLLTDPNGNQTAAAFDTWGMVVGTAVMGKPGPNPEDPPETGDWLEQFDPDLPDEVIAAYLADPFSDPHALLGQATTRLIYDLHAYYRARDESQPSPMVVATLARETHAAELQPGEQTKTRHSFVYTDGFGREIQQKIQAEPGPLADDGPEVSPRWVGSGWTIFNNKGQPVRQYEPFFSGTHLFEFDVRRGVSPILFYDPVGRVVGTLHPNYIWQKVVFDAWRQETWDVNDTVLIEDPLSDLDLGDFFSRLPVSEVLPTWYDARMGGALGPQEQAAAEKAAAHAGTPTVAHLDSLARTFLTVAHNRLSRGSGSVVDEFDRTAVEFDIEGNQREMIDARERSVMRFDYDQLGSVIHTSSMDSGEHWMLQDVMGGARRAWDGRGHTFRTEYDRLHRPLRQYVLGTDAVQSDPRLLGREVLFQQMEYGEGQAGDRLLNLCTHVWKAYDGAGVAASVAYDYNGNLLRSTRQLAADYQGVPDWSGSVTLEAEIFTSRTAYDALNRPTSLTTPDNSEICPRYNEASLLEGVQARLRGASDWTDFVLDVDYNAKGQRQAIVYGNTTETSYEYDPLTFRLLRLTTHRNTDGAVLQDLSYTYDPIGNITAILDDAQQTIFFNNSAVAPHAGYTYDARYQLIRAEGREHIGLTGQVDQLDPEIMPLPHPGNREALRRYTEQYEYDAVGNLLAMIHQAGSGSWTRRYEYDAGSNRLLGTSLPGDDPNGPYTARYAYNTHGSMVSMPHLAEVRWDFQEHMQQVDLGGGGTAFYVYDAAGQRVRKVHLHNGGTVEERIYLGGWEIYRQHVAGTLRQERESLHILDGQQRIALVETQTVHDGVPVNTPSSLLRYQLGNHLGSACLELDAAGLAITYEEYHPYGTTAYQSAANSLEASPKRYRYTDKEKDEETALYYHGARYYACWLGKWTNADPMGIGDGVNLYQYGKNNPVRNLDSTGMFTESTDRGKVKDRNSLITGMQRWESLVNTQQPNSSLQDKLQFFADDFNADINDQVVQNFGSYYKQFGKYTGVGGGNGVKSFPIDFEHFIKNAALAYNKPRTNNYAAYAKPAAERLLIGSYFYGVVGLGVVEEAYQAVTPFAKNNAARTSAFSPEDLVSNYFGLLYGYRLAEQDSSVTFAAYTEQYFSELDKVFRGEDLGSNTLITAQDVGLIETIVGSSLPDFAKELPTNAKNLQAHMDRVQQVQNALETDSLPGWYAGGVIKLGYGLKDVVWEGSRFSTQAELVDKLQTHAAASRKHYDFAGIPQDIGGIPIENYADKVLLWALTP